MPLFTESPAIIGRHAPRVRGRHRRRQASAAMLPPTVESPEAAVTVAEEHPLDACSSKHTQPAAIVEDQQLSKQQQHPPDCTLQVQQEQQLGVSLYVSPAELIGSSTSDSFNMQQWLQAQACRPRPTHSQTLASINRLLAESVQYSTASCNSCMTGLGLGALTGLHGGASVDASGFLHGGINAAVAAATAAAELHCSKQGPLLAPSCLQSCHVLSDPGVKVLASVAASSCSSSTSMFGTAGLELNAAVVHSTSFEHEDLLCSSYASGGSGEKREQGQGREQQQQGSTGGKGSSRKVPVGCSWFGNLGKWVALSARVDEGDSMEASVEADPLVGACNTEFGGFWSTAKAAAENSRYCADPESPGLPAVDGDHACDAGQDKVGADAGRYDRMSSSSSPATPAAAWHNRGAASTEAGHGNSTPAASFSAAVAAGGGVGGFQTLSYTTTPCSRPLSQSTTAPAPQSSNSFSTPIHLHNQRQREQQSSNAMDQLLLLMSIDESVELRASFGAFGSPQVLISSPQLSVHSPWLDAQLAGTVPGLATGARVTEGETAAAGEGGEGGGNSAAGLQAGSGSWQQLPPTPMPFSMGRSPSRSALDTPGAAAAADSMGDPTSPYTHTPCGAATTQWGQQGEAVNHSVADGVNGVAASDRVPSPGTLLLAELGLDSSYNSSMAGSPYSGGRAGGEDSGSGSSSKWDSSNGSLGDEAGEGRGEMEDAGASLAMSSSQLCRLSDRDSSSTRSSTEQLLQKHEGDGRVVGVKSGEDTHRSSCSRRNDPSGMHADMYEVQNDGLGSGLRPRVGGVDFKGKGVVVAAGIGRGAGSLQLQNVEQQQQQKRQELLLAVCPAVAEILHEGDPVTPTWSLLRSKGLDGQSLRAEGSEGSRLSTVVSPGGTGRDLAYDLGPGASAKGPAELTPSCSERSFYMGLAGQQIYGAATPLGPISSNHDRQQQEQGRRGLRRSLSTGCLHAGSGEGPSSGDSLIGGVGSLWRAAASMSGSTSYGGGAEHGVSRGADGLTTVTPVAAGARMGSDRVGAAATGVGSRSGAGILSALYSPSAGPGAAESKGGGWGGWGARLTSTPGASSGGLNVVVNPLAVHALTDQLGTAEKRVQELQQQLEQQSKELQEKDAQVG